MSDRYLLRFALRDLLRPKKLLAAAVLIALPTFLAVQILWHNQDGATPTDVYNVMAGGLVFGVVLVLLAVVFGTSVVSQELEQKTIVYLLTRPVPRWRILLTKFAAALVAVVVTVGLADVTLALATHGPRELGATRLVRDLQVLTVGAVAYGALFLLLGVMLNRPLMWGLLFAFGWESWVPTLPGRFGRVSVMTYLRVLAPHPPPELEDVDITEVFKLLNPKEIPEATAWWTLLGIIAVALVLAMLIFSRSEYVPREDAE